MKWTHHDVALERSLAQHGILVRAAIVEDKKARRFLPRTRHAKLKPASLKHAHLPRRRQITRIAKFYDHGIILAQRRHVPDTTTFRQFGSYLNRCVACVT